MRTQAIRTVVLLIITFVWAVLWYHYHSLGVQFWLVATREVGGNFRSQSSIYANIFLALGVMSAIGTVVSAVFNLKEWRHKNL